MQASDRTQLRAAIEKRAAELGFLRLGFVDLEHSTPDIASYDAWIAEGRHGDMSYLPEQRDARADDQHLLPDAKTAIVCLASYAGHSDDLGSMRVARYAQGDDYHERLTERLESLAAFVRAESGADSTRAAADMFPILERDLARRAGLGWIGKNTMLIDSTAGSFTFIGTLLVDAPLAGDQVPEHPDRCGRCRACIDVCPTQAIVAPGVIDARRCISYLTIELRGPIPRRLRPLIGRHIFGCDLCQNVCPWNSKAPPADAAAAMGFGRRELFDGLTPQDILRMRRDEYARAFRGSAMKRARYDGLGRNAAVVLGNSGAAEHAGVLVEQLWEHDEPLVRGHIAWALSRISWSGAESALRNRSVIERDAYVQEEIRWALSNAVSS